MLSDTEKERLRRLAHTATPGPRVLRPRHIEMDSQIQNGAEPIAVAELAGENWLGWEVDYNTGFAQPGRGDFTGYDAAFLMATSPEVILSLLEEIDQLKE